MSAAKKNLLWKGILTKKRLPLHLSYKVKCYVHPKGWSSEDLFHQFLDRKAEDRKLRQEMGIEAYNKKKSSGSILMPSPSLRGR